MAQEAGAPSTSRPRVGRVDFLPDPSGVRARYVLIGRVLLFGAAYLLISSFSFAWVLGGSLVRSSGLAFGLCLVAFASSGVQAWFTRRGASLRWAARVSLGLAVIDQLLVSGLVYLTGGAASPATSLYGVACLAAGLLLGVPGAALTGVAGGVCLSVTVLLVRSDLLLPPRDQTGTYLWLSGDQTLYYLVINVLVLALVALLVSYLAERLERASSELADARQRAAQAERMASMGRLAAGLAHEIRNPLSSIAGAVQMLKTGAPSEEDRLLCEIVLREAARLDELVTDMVDLARPRHPDKRVVDASAIVDDVVELMKSTEAERNSIRVVRVGSGSAFIEADPGQLRQLLWNLVRNAVQSSAAAGEVRVGIERDRALELFVEDDGAGLDSVAKQHLFDIFFTTRSHGSGIGLAVVKRIADEHGFSVSVTSEQGAGARFSVSLGPELSPEKRLSMTS